MIGGLIQAGWPSSFQLSAQIHTKAVPETRSTLARSRKACRAWASSRDDSDDGNNCEEESEKRATDWRTFRANLIASEDTVLDSESPSQNADPIAKTPEDKEIIELHNAGMSENLKLLQFQNPKLAKEPHWAHPTSTPEVGGVLVASEDMALLGDNRFWQAVILIIYMDRNATIGLILNRPTQFSIGELPVTKNFKDTFGGSTLYYGGPDQETNLLSLHGNEAIGGNEIMKGLYLGDVDKLIKAAREETIRPIETRFFGGWASWSPGQLNQELEKGVWYTGACSRSIALKQCLRLPQPLWREVLHLMGGKYAKISLDDRKRQE